MVRSNTPVYDSLFDLGKKKLVKVQHTGIRCILNLGCKKSVKVEFIGMWYIRPWLGRIYRNVVYSTMVWSNEPDCGIFDHGKVEYTGIWFIIQFWSTVILVGLGLVVLDSLIHFGSSIAVNFKIKDSDWPPILSLTTARDRIELLFYTTVSGL